MKPKPQMRIKFDVKGIKERLIHEDKYIINVWSRISGLNPSVSKENDDDDDDDDDGTTVKDSRPVRVFGAGTQRARTLEELYNKLDEIKGKKLLYKERLLKKGLKNKVGKKKRKEERKLKKTLSKMNKQTPNFKTGDLKPKPTKPAKPVFNSEGKIVFSKFDFTESGNEVHNKKDRASKDPQKLIKKLEKQKEKLKQLEEKGEMEKVSEIKEKQAWKTALLRAGGAKVKDDPALLKKTIVKQKQQKKQSRKKWQAREAQVHRQMEDKQRKRKSNIEEHKRKKKAKKAKKLVKKGRIIPGY